MEGMQERNFANAFLISFDAEATSFFTEQHVELRPGLSEHKYLSVWEHDYLQYSWIVFRIVRPQSQQFKYRPTNSGQFSIV